MYSHTKLVPRCYGRKRVSKCLLMNSAPDVSHTFCRISPKLILGENKAKHAARSRRTVGTLPVLVMRIMPKTSSFYFAGLSDLCT